MKQNQEGFTPEEQTKNEIELIKLKLEVENGAVIQTSNGAIPPEIELAWFNHIHNYERMCKEAGYATVYEAIGKPSYQKIVEISEENRETALEQLLSLMHEQGVDLHYMDGFYSPETIYKFITEELFEEQMCLYRGPEGNAFTMFSYEEFHPNHRYDLESVTEEWLESILGEKEWIPQWLDHYYENNVTLNHQYLPIAEYSDKVILFKKTYPSFLFSEKKISHIEFDMQIKKGSVMGSFNMNQEIFSFTLHLNYDFLWLISHVEMKLL